MYPMKFVPALSLLISQVLLLASAPAQPGANEANLISNGNFEIADANGHPQDWEISHPEFLKKCETTLELISEGDETFYRITKNAAFEPGLCSQKIDIPEATGSIRIAAKMRGKNIMRGAEGWNIPGLAVTYFYNDDQDAKPGSVDNWLKVPTGDSAWQDYEAIIPVCDGATRASISIVGKGRTGTFDITDVVVEIME